MSNLQTETVALYFKQVYTCNTHMYRVNYDSTIAQLYEFITAKAYSDDFGIDPNYNIEIVEAGQFDNVNGRHAELAPALNKNSELTLREKYRDNIKNIAFYIRPKLFINIPVIVETTYEDMIVLAPRT